MAKVVYADDDTSSVGMLLKLRIPSLALGMGLGIVLSIITSGFEKVLRTHVEIAYFIPFVVYMADAVGTQTQAIYTRDLRTRKAVFAKYLIKETMVGAIIGLMTGILAAIFVYVWFSKPTLAMAVGLSMFASVALAPLIALLITELLHLEHTDPAVGAGPIATVLQDTASVVIYGLIASIVVL